MIVRETIYAALWELGASAAQFTSTNRRLRHWADVAPAEQPALFMSEKGGQAAKKAWRADRMDTLRRILRVRPFERPLYGAGSGFEPAA